MLTMNVVVAQQTSMPNVATGQLPENAVVRSVFSWPQRTEEDAFVVFLRD